VLDRTIDSADAETRVSGETVSKEAPHIADRLDGRTDDRAEAHGPGDSTARQRGRARLRDWLARGAQFFVTQSSSSLTRRIVSLNIAGLLALVASILYLSQFRAGLIDARAQSLLVQAEIIAGAIAASATVETNTITIDPDRLLDLKPGETYGAPDEYAGLDFPINPERVAPVLRRLISPTKTRARIFDRDGGLILDSRNLYGRGDVLRFELPPPSVEKPGIAERTMIAIRTWLNRGKELQLLALYEQRIHRAIAKNMAQLRALRAERQAADAPFAGELFGGRDGADGADRAGDTSEDHSGPKCV